ncbi:MAG: hypothetical protein ACUVT5_00860 [Candidatus Bathyarchaeales archaeon]
MKNLLKSKKGLSTVVTTLIILVVSVLLATVVTFYTINITTNRVQQESLYMSKLHVWYNTTGGWAQAAFVLINTGGKDVVIDKITARSQTSDWTEVYYWRTNTVTITMDLIVTPTQLSGTTYNHTIQNASRTLTQATDDITLKSGWTIVIYINNPDSVGQNDVGTPVEITVYTANAHWSQECNVEAAQ